MRAKPQDSIATARIRPSAAHLKDLRPALQLNDGASSSLSATDCSMAAGVKNFILHDATKKRICHLSLLHSWL